MKSEGRCMAVWADARAVRPYIPHPLRLFLHEKRCKHVGTHGSYVRYINHLVRQNDRDGNATWAGFASQMMVLRRPKLVNILLNLMLARNNIVEKDYLCIV